MNLKLFLSTTVIFFATTFYVFAQNNLPPVQSWHFINNTKVPKERYNLDQEGKVHGVAYTYDKEGE
jgi:hypothetical protein